MLLRKLAPDMTAAFDAANRLMQRSNRSLSYDDNGNLVNDGTKTYTWDARNQLTFLSTGASFSYDATGRRINGAQGAFYRSNAENLITRIDEFGWPIQHGDDEDRDEGDDRSDREDGIGHVKHFTYRYDGANRVTDVIAKSGAYYDYDLADNLLSAKGRKIDFAASYNDVNQIVAANSANYQYDVNGNLLDDGKRQYVWDAENRLLSITDKTIPGKLTKFRYDGLSRRLAIIDQANSAATSIENRYLWCDRILCQEDSHGILVTGSGLACRLPDMPSLILRSDRRDEIHPQCSQSHPQDKTIRAPSSGEQAQGQVLTSRF